MEGNQMKIREALVKVLRLANVTADGENWDWNNAIAENVVKVVKEALAAPPRNCDAGTAEEQEKRWQKNCGSGIPNCKHCKVYGQAKESGFVSGRGFLLSCSCKFVWAQMPYEEERKGGAK